MCTSAFSSDVCHCLQCPLLLQEWWRYNVRYVTTCCNRQTCIQSVRSASFFLKTFSKHFTAMCAPALNCDFPIIAQPPSWFPRNPHVCIPLRLMAHFPSSHKKITNQYFFKLAEIWQSKCFDFQCLISRSFEVKGQGRIQFPSYGFIIVLHTKYGSI